jgi:tetratricopeptide (TPR) repeat protein
MMNRIKRLSLYVKVQGIFLLLGVLSLFFRGPPAFSEIGFKRLEMASGAVKSPFFHDAIIHGINLVFNDRYEEGLVVFQRLQEMYPDHPAPFFFKAALYQTWMSCFRTNKFQKELEENIQLTIEKGYQLLKNEDDPWAHYYIGAAYGYWALNCFRKNDWISAYIKSRKSIKNLKKALAKDASLYDAYLGLGAYNYWRTAKSKFIQVVAFWMSDKRELGLRQIQLSVERGLYASNVAIYTLIAAYFDYGMYDRAFEWVHHTIDKKDNRNISDLYYKGRVMAQFEKWQEVELLFRKILQFLERSDLSSTGYLIECRYWIALSLAAQNKIAEASQMTEAALSQSKKRKAGGELEGPFDSFGEIMDRLEKLYIALRKEEKSPIITLKNDIQ